MSAAAAAASDSAIVTLSVKGIVDVRARSDDARTRTSDIGCCAGVQEVESRMTECDEYTAGKSTVKLKLE
jgi:hypothetical protein